MITQFNAVTGPLQQPPAQVRRRHEVFMIDKARAGQPCGLGLGAVPGGRSGVCGTRGRAGECGVFGARCAAARAWWRRGAPLAHQTRSLFCFGAKAKFLQLTVSLFP